MIDDNEFTMYPFNGGYQPRYNSYYQQYGNMAQNNSNYNMMPVALGQPRQFYSAPIPQWNNQPSMNFQNTVSYPMTRLQWIKNRRHFSAAHHPYPSSQIGQPKRKKHKKKHGNSTSTVTSPGQFASRKRSHPTSTEDDTCVAVKRRMPTVSMRDTQNDEISEKIWEYFETNRQPDEAYMAKVNLRDALYAVFKDVFTYCGLYMVGSSMSGFATKSSDLDLCLMLSKEPDIENESLNILQAFQSCLDKCEFMDRSKLIQTKQGHILKFKDNQGHIPCYLHINNAVGIRNTHLLRYYAIMDWRVRPLIAYLKMWARFHDINDPSNQTISSYSLSLMMIHYLQYFTRPPVLPSIQKMYPELFEVDIENLKMDAEVKYDTKNTQSLGDLFMGFLEYYAVQFDYDKDVASVRLASKLSVDVVVSMVPKNEPNKWTYLKIEEPFDRRNTAYACYNFKAFARIKRVFVNSYIQLRETKKLSSIFEKKIDSSVGWRSELKKPNAEGKSQNKHA